MIAVPSIGGDFTGVRAEVHPTQAAKLKAIRRVIPGAACEGTGKSVDFAAIRNRKPLVPVILNRDPRGYSLKIDDGWMGQHEFQLHCDWGGYGIIAPDLSEHT